MVRPREQHRSGNRRGGGYNGTVDTVWVLGDQLNRRIGALADADPAGTRVLLVESEAAVAGRPVHRQRLHLVVTAMRRFAEELRSAGFEVDLRRAGDLWAGLEDHLAEHPTDRVLVTEPLSWSMLHALEARDEVELVRSDQFLCHRDEFAEWADGRKRTRMEDFYRWQRVRLGYLMDGDEPAGGRWNFDHDNREPPPAGEAPWPTPARSRLDDLDREVLAGLPDSAFGDDPEGWWPTSRRAALARLDHFAERVLPHFGPHEDAMLGDDWHLAHSLLSPALNLGLLLPDEVADRAEEAYRSGDVPIASAEGFVRQVIGWREYVWGMYWRHMPGWLDQNVFGHDGPVPPAYRGEADTHMACLTAALDGVRRRGWTHHIQRLMVLASFANMVGVAPRALMNWMHVSFVDGAEWVMVPNVIGMATWADGGTMATKPYVSGGAYLNRMSDHCRGCRYDPKQRTDPDACPFTTLYWDFLARHREQLSGNHRMAQPIKGLDRLADLKETRERAAEVRGLLAAGEL